MTDSRMTVFSLPPPPSFLGVGLLSLEVAECAAASVLHRLAVFLSSAAGHLSELLVLLHHLSSDLSSSGNLAAAAFLLVFIQPLGLSSQEKKDKVSV